MIPNTQLWHCPNCTTRIKKYFENKILEHIKDCRITEQQLQPQELCIDCNTHNGKYRGSFGVRLCDVCHKLRWETKRAEAFGDDR